MKIAVVNNFFPPRVGGSSHLSDALARAYAEHGHEVLVITAAYRDAPASERRDGIEIRRLPAWTLPRLGTAIDFDVSFTLGPRNLRGVFRILDGFGPDVIHAHGQFLDLSWTAGLYARRRSVPMLMSVHTRLEGTSRGYDALFRMLDAVVVRPTLAVSRPRFVVMDQLMHEYIVRRYGARETDLVPIPVGVDTALLDATGDAGVVREQLGLGDRPVVLSLGHVIPLRDRLALVEALPAVVARHPDAALVVVGDVLYPAFLDRADELGVRDHVITTGAVPKSSIPDYLAAADVECHDLQGFGLGTASLEAMYSGVPVVAALRADNFPGVELSSGENITLVDVGDTAALAHAIVGLLDDRAHASRVAAAQRDLVASHFTMERVVEAHLDELGRMAEGVSAQMP